MEDFKIIKGLSQYWIGCSGTIKRVSDGKVMKHSTTARYPQLTLFNDNNALCTFNVHRLVAKAFVPNPNGYLQVNHKDDVKSNNHYTNLYWGTQSQNMKDCYNNGYKSHISKKIIQLNLKGEFIMEHVSIRDAAKYLGVKENAIQNCIQGRSFTSNGFRWVEEGKEGLSIGS